METQTMITVVISILTSLFVLYLLAIGVIIYVLSGVSIIHACGINISQKRYDIPIYFKKGIEISTKELCKSFCVRFWILMFFIVLPIIMVPFLHIIVFFGFIFSLIFIIITIPILPYSFYIITMFGALLSYTQTFVKKSVKNVTTYDSEAEEIEGQVNEESENENEEVELKEDISMYELKKENVNKNVNERRKKVFLDYIFGDFKERKKKFEINQSRGALKIVDLNDNKYYVTVHHNIKYKEKPYFIVRNCKTHEIVNVIINSKVNITKVIPKEIMFQTKAYYFGYFNSGFVFIVRLSMDLKSAYVQRNGFEGVKCIIPMPNGMIVYHIHDKIGLTVQKEIGKVLEWPIMNLKYFSNKKELFGGLYHEGRSFVLNVRNDVITISVHEINRNKGILTMENNYIQIARQTAKHRFIKACISSGDLLLPIGRCIFIIDLEKSLNERNNKRELVLRKCHIAGNLKRVITIDIVNINHFQSIWNIHEENHNYLFSFGKTHTNKNEKVFSKAKNILSKKRRVVYTFILDHSVIAYIVNVGHISKNPCLKKLIIFQSVNNGKELARFPCKMSPIDEYPLFTKPKFGSFLFYKVLNGKYGTINLSVYRFCMTDWNCTLLGKMKTRQCLRLNQIKNQVIFGNLKEVRAFKIVELKKILFVLWVLLKKLPKDVIQFEIFRYLGLVL